MNNERKNISLSAKRVSNSEVLFMALRPVSVIVTRGFITDLPY
jgi:hypothetical protein